MMQRRAMTATEKESRARKMHRERARESRRVQQEHLAYLRAKVADLTRVLSTKTEPLAWREIASALESHAEEAKMTNRELKHRVRRGQEIMAALAAWASSSHPDEAIDTHGDWRQHALVHTGDARMQSFAWLTERMLHNKERALGQRWDSASAVTLVEPAHEHGAAAYVVLRLARIIQASVAECTETQRRIYFQGWHDDEGDVSVESEALTRAFGQDVAYLHFPASNELCLYRLFECTDESSVLVMNSIVDDAAQPDLGNASAPMLAWIAIDKIDDTTTRMADLLVVRLTPLATEAEYAERLHVDLETVGAMSDDARFEALKRMAVNELEHNMWHCEQLFFDSLVKVQQTNTPVNVSGDDGR
ncbi:Aste57867_10805 [Aphanomyces stellatus]|uniref:Aste57867_10805 protein n=1 Tax=Aphanomyces stellatus TaxID=120398 RepID=A0A485KRB1_9STRA|nr:hypothetical protein As57867_010765 [Aphanomyces stellatus]VFT87674.1 Aste57867_10805 [Aphanomyces stellatus]